MTNHTYHDKLTNTEWAVTIASGYSSIGLAYRHTCVCGSLVSATSSEQCALNYLAHAMVSGNHAAYLESKKRQQRSINDEAVSPTPEEKPLIDETSVKYWSYATGLTIDHVIKLLREGFVFYEFDGRVGFDKGKD